MDGSDDTDGSLDPRIEIELENLNKATDDINKLETELDEAHTAFSQLLSESTRRLKKIVDKVGSGCIEKARCYYEALEIAHEARVQCQQQAQSFQRASEIHAAAKETVALAEARFMSHQHEWNFDQAWQDMLNHATLKVMDAENQKAECAREHHRRAMLFHDAERRLLELEEKHRRSIIKARPYFEVKAQCDQMLATQKERVECLQKTIKDAKNTYASSLRVLEDISNQIHQQRRDYDFVVNGPREPGVGAELEGSESNQLVNSRISPAPSAQLKRESKLQDVQEICEVKEDAEHLGKRSVDGSEATSSQWELELQTSMENLNNSSHEGLHLYIEDKSSNQGIENAHKSNISPQANQLTVETLNHFRKVSRRSLKSSSSVSHVQSLGKHEPGDPLDTSKTRVPLRGYTSLTNSPINSYATTLDASARACDGTESLVPNKLAEILRNNQNFHCNSEINLSWNLDITSIQKQQSLPGDDSSTSKALDNKTEGTEFPEAKSQITTGPSASDALEEESGENRPKPSVLPRISLSASSTPVRVKNALATGTLEKSENLGKYSVLKALASKTTGVKELPLLSMFTRANGFSSNKSKSMINLNDKQNLATIMDNSQLDNIKNVSVERLANARHNLFPRVPRVISRGDKVTPGFAEEHRRKSSSNFKVADANNKQIQIKATSHRVREKPEEEK